MKLKTRLNAVCTALLLTGCAAKDDGKLLDLQRELAQLQAENSQLQQTNDELKHQVSQPPPVEQSAVAGNYMLPPNAKTGECYARVFVPEKYRIETKQLLKKEAGFEIQVSEPEYEWVEEKILVKEESEVAEVVPAKYEWRTEKVLVKEAHEHLKRIPAVYETREEKVLVKPAHTVWKKGRGPIEKMDYVTGEIMCLVEVPAEYKTVTKKMLVTPERTEKVMHPAVYKEVGKYVIVEQPKIKIKTIPAEYKTVKVKKIVRPAQETKVPVPAEYQAIEQQVKIADSYMEWRRILCETNSTPDVIRRLQGALVAAGYNPGEIDGLVGGATLRAVKRYQRDNNLAVGQLTIETLEKLGVKYH